MPEIVEVIGASYDCVEPGFFNPGMENCDRIPERDR
jgi:hypothetical protein